jgi:hypothetical protein
LKKDNSLQLAAKTLELSHYDHRFSSLQHRDNLIRLKMNCGKELFADDGLRAKDYIVKLKPKIK